MCVNPELQAEDGKASGQSPNKGSLAGWPGMTQFHVQRDALLKSVTTWTASILLEQNGVHNVSQLAFVCITESNDRRQLQLQNLYP